MEKVNKMIEERSEKIKSMGLNILRFCNLEIDRNFREVCEKIDLVIKNLSFSQRG